MAGGADGTAEVVGGRRFLRARPGGDLGAVLVLLAVLAVGVGASAVEPRFLAGVGDALRRMGGIWRVLVLPLPVTLLVVALGANLRAPGATWARVRSRPDRWWRGAAFAVAIALALLGSGLQAGVTLTQLSRPAVLWILQLVLHPDTPTAIVASAALVAVVVADRRGFVVLPWAIDAGARVARRTWGWAAPGIPAGAAMVAAGVAAAAVYPDAMQGWFRPDPTDAQAYNLYSSFFNYAISKDKIVEFDGYELGEAGLMLAPGRTGVLTFALDRPEGSLTLLRPNFYHKTFLNKKDSFSSFEEKTFSNRIDISMDGGRSFLAVAKDQSFGQVLGNAELDLTDALGDSRAYLLRFWAENTTSEPALVLPIIIISVVVDPLAYPSRYFRSVLYTSSVALICALSIKLGILRTLGVSGAARAITFGARAQTLLVCLTASLVFFCAIDLRWNVLYSHRFDFLYPDAQGYLQIARSFAEKMQNRGSTKNMMIFSDLYNEGFDGKTSYLSVFYFGNHNGREPLWPAVLDVVGRVIGHSAFHVRLASILLGATVAAASVFLGSRHFHVCAGVIAGLLVAANEPHITNSIQGLREELVTVLIIGATGALWKTSGQMALLGRPSLHVATRPRHRWADRWPIAGVTLPVGRIAVASLACAAIILTRADMVVMVALILATLAIAYRWGWRTWLPMGVAIVVLVAPMYVGYWFTHGDPFWPGTYGATVNRNLEFPERMGTPGFPSAAEYAANWAAGPLISPFTYFFGYHSPGQFLAYSVNGFERIFREVLFPGQPIVLASFWVGLALTVATRQWLVPWGIAVGLFPFYAFMAGVPSNWVFPGRYAHQVLPFAAMAVAYAWTYLPLMAWRWYARRRVPDVSAPSGGVVAVVRG